MKTIEMALPMGGGLMMDEEKVTWYTNVSRIKRKISDKLGRCKKF